MICGECIEPFPDDLVRDVCLNGAYRRVCGVCALKLVRQAHGLPTYMFEGPQARSIYERCKRIKDKRKAKGRAK